MWSVGIGSQHWRVARSDERVKTVPLVRQIRNHNKISVKYLTLLLFLIYTLNNIHLLIFIYFYTFPILLCFYLVYYFNKKIEKKKSYMFHYILSNTEWGRWSADGIRVEVCSQWLLRDPGTGKTFLTMVCPWVDMLAPGGTVSWLSMRYKPYRWVSFCWQGDKFNGFSQQKLGEQEGLPQVSGIIPVSHSVRTRVWRTEGSVEGYHP